MHCIKYYMYASENESYKTLNNEYITAVNKICTSHIHVNFWIWVLIASAPDRCIVFTSLEAGNGKMYPSEKQVNYVLSNLLLFKKL